MSVSSCHAYSMMMYKGKYFTEDDGETVSSVVGSQDPQQQLDDWTSQDPDPTSQFDYSQPQDRGNIGRYTDKLINTVI